MPTMETCYVWEILEALESSASSLCYRVSEEGTSPRSLPRLTQDRQFRAGWRKRMRYEVKRASFIVPVLTLHNYIAFHFRGFFSYKMDGDSYLKEPRALKPTDIPHVRRLQWFKIDGAGLIKSYNLPLWTLPHKIIVLKSNRLSPLSPTTQVRDPGLYQSENWTVTPLLTVADLWSNQNAFISSFSSLFVNSNRPIHS